MNKGGMGWGHAKMEFFEILNAWIKEPRARYQELRRDERQLNLVLENGAERASEVGLKVLDRVRHAIGYAPFPFQRIVRS